MARGGNELNGLAAVGSADLPDLVPARMVNEYTYCPRLFYLEWVQKQWADNADTAEGSWAHRVVDTAPTRPRDTDALPKRSVAMSSERLGLTAVIDVLERDGDHAVPVDYKRGRPPDNEHKAWDPERVQLCVQGLVLRDNGIECDHGVLYFVESKQRVVVPFDDELLALTLRTVLDLRRVAVAAAPPRPLVDSSKCPRCSLVGICLPDEINHLAGRSDGKSRYLLPGADAARPLYLTEPGAWAQKRKGRVEVTKGGETLATARLLDVSQINVFSNVQVSTQLLHECFERQIPVAYFSLGGRFRGLAGGLPHKNVDVRIRQVGLAARDAGLSPSVEMVRGKIRNGRAILRRNARTDVSPAVSQLGRLADRAADVESAASLLGVEGTAARIYWSAFPSMLSERVDGLPGRPFAFDGRSRRPPLDPVNCLLSFGYALLVKDLTVVAWGVGLDPYVGVYHRPRYGRPALALDLAEEFRPVIVDSMVLTLINNGEVSPDDFVARKGGIALTPGGRKAVLSAYERRLETEIKHPIFGYRAPYRRIFEVQARLFAAFLLGEIDAYESFRVR